MPRDNGQGHIGRENKQEDLKNKKKNVSTQQDLEMDKLPKEKGLDKGLDKDQSEKPERFDKGRGK